VNTLIWVEHDNASVKDATLAVVTAASKLGEVTALVHGGAQDLLIIRTADGREALVPFVKALVPEVDLAAGRVVVADRPGLVTPLPEDE